MTDNKIQQHLTLSLPTVKPASIWVHACSVGEVASVIPLIEQLLEQTYSVHLSVVTATGFAFAQQKLGERVSVSFLPWDLPGLMRRWVKHVQPSVLLLTETEFWPGMLNACKRFKIPVIGINTRISDRSFPRYHASRWLWRKWLKSVNLFLAQSEVDAQRLQQMGISSDRVEAVGNLKYAASAPNVDACLLRRQLDPGGNRPILVLASTHDDEEMRVLRMLPLWQQICSDLLLVVVPRHPQRFDAVADQMLQEGVAIRRWSEMNKTSTDVVLIDAMGILQQFYTIADIVVIGGSLVDVGGHNPLEAAVCGRGVITGPHVQNFRQVMQDMSRLGAAVVCQSDAELLQAVQRMLTHSDELKQMHEKAAAMMLDQQQVLHRVLDKITPWLPKQ